MRSGRVLGPHRRRGPERNSIGNGDGLFHGVERKEHQDRTEDLRLRRTASGDTPVENGGSHVVAAGLDQCARAASDRNRALGDRGVNVSEYPLQVILLNHRPQCRCRIERIGVREGFRSAHHRFQVRLGGSGALSGVSGRSRSVPG
jgi:hypothetical protein